MHPTRIRILSALIFAVTLTAAAQSSKSPCANPANQTLKTFYIANPGQQNNSDNIVTALRNMLDPCVKIYFVPEQQAILLNAPQDQIALADRILQDLDHPAKSFRLTFTLVDYEGANALGMRRYTMTVEGGHTVILKVGDKVPVVTTSTESDGDAAKSQTRSQVNYIDAGMRFDITLKPFATNLQLLFTVEQSSIAAQPAKSTPPVQHPQLHELLLQGVTTIATGLPQVLGSLDIPDTQHRTEITVTIDPVS